MENIYKMYQQVIIDYSKIKDNNRDIVTANYVERGHNPSCGDDITIILKFNDEIIEDISFLGHGCAISTASTNMLIEAVKGKNIDNVIKILNTFFDMMKSNKVEDYYVDILGDIVSLHFTNDMPARIKCATLPWHSMDIILKKIKKEL